MKEQEELLESESGLDMEENNSSTIYPNAEVRVEKAQFSILHLLRLCVERKEIIISPDFQRNDVWKGRQTSELIESILMGIPIPIMYLFETREGKKQVVDGRQRIDTILRFLDNGFRLKDLKILHSLNGSLFKELDPKLQGIFEDYQLFFYIIQPPTPERVKYDIFDRVNRGGTRLNNQEMRNALYRGNATFLIDEICISDEFKKATGEGVSSIRMRDRYIVLRAIAFYLLMTNQLQTADLGKPIEYRSDIDDFLAKVMIFMNQRMSQEEIEKLKEKFLTALKKIYSLLGEDAFRFAGINKRRPINMPLFECLTYLFLLEWDWNDNKEIYLSIENLKDSLDKSGSFQGNVDSITSLGYRYSRINQFFKSLQQ